MENGAILDSQVSASSTHTWSNFPTLARLNLQPASPLGSWVASSTDSYPWLQVDFFTHAKISGIITQGQADTSSFVATFTVSFGNNNKDFQKYEEFRRVKVSSWAAEMVVNTVFEFCIIYPITNVNWFLCRKYFY